MLRAALLRRSCDGVAAATESLLRGSRCCDGDAQTSSVALILRVASRRDALNEEPASFPPGDSNFNSWPEVLGHPPGPVICARVSKLIVRLDAKNRASAGETCPRRAKNNLGGLKDSFCFRLVSSSSKQVQQKETHLSSFTLCSLFALPAHPSLVSRLSILSDHAWLDSHTDCCDARRLVRGGGRGLGRHRSPSDTKPSNLEGRRGRMRT